MQKNIWTAPQRALWPHGRIGYIFIGTAVAQLGRAMFPDWSDDDPAAEYLTPHPEPAEPHKISGGRSMTPGGRPAQSFEAQYAEYQKQHAEWMHRSQQIIAHNEKIFPAFSRARAVFDVILRAVQQDGLMLVNPTARPHMMISIPPYFWELADPYHCFTTGKSDFPLRPGQSASPSSGEKWIFVGQRDFEANPTIEKAMARRVAPSLIDQNPVKPAARIIAKEQSDAWYRERVAEARRLGIRYSRDEDQKAGRAQGISRPRIRELRSLHAPEWTQKDGRPPR